MDKKNGWVLTLDRIKYDDAFGLQKNLVDARSKNKIRDTFILLEHLPVFTANRKDTFKNILAPEEILAKEGIEVCKTDRGGDVTYHGPGQVVGYNIMDLKDQERDLHAYIRNMEQMIINTLGDFGITAGRDPNHPGVWVKNEKICAIGIAVKSGWITMHGFALNVNPNMQHYKMIIACGIADKGVTSMSAVLGRTVAVSELIEPLIENYEKIFNRQLTKITPEELSWS